MVSIGFGLLVLQGSDGQPLSQTIVCLLRAFNICFCSLLLELVGHE